MTRFLQLWHHMTQITGFATTYYSVSAQSTSLHTHEIAYTLFYTSTMFYHSICLRNGAEIINLAPALFRIWQKLWRIQLQLLANIVSQMHTSVKQSWHRFKTKSYVHLICEGRIRHKKSNHHTIRVHHFSCHFAFHFTICIAHCLISSTAYIFLHYYGTFSTNPCTLWCSNDA